MDDLRYIATHPLLQRIYKRCGELMNELEGLAEGTKEKQELERRISLLQQYGLPKPDGFDAHGKRTIKNELGETIGFAHSARQRLKDKHRGQQERHRIRVRAALEEKIRYPQRLWRALAAKHGLERWDLERQVGLLRALLKREGIEIPSIQDCRNAERALARACTSFKLSRQGDKTIFSTVRRLFRMQTEKASNNRLIPRSTQPTGPGFSCQ